MFIACQVNVRQCTLACLKRWPSNIAVWADRAGSPSSLSCAGQLCGCTLGGPPVLPVWNQTLMCAGCGPRVVVVRRRWTSSMVCDRLRVRETVYSQVSAVGHWEPHSTYERAVTHTARRARRTRAVILYKYTVYDIDIYIGFYLWLVYCIESSDTAISFACGANHAAAAGQCVARASLASRTHCVIDYTRSKI